MAVRPVIGTIAEVIAHVVAFVGSVLVASDAGLSFFPVMAIAGAAFLAVVLLSRSVAFSWTRSAGDRARLNDALARNVPYVCAVLLAFLAWRFGRPGSVSVIIGCATFGVLTLVFWHIRRPAA